MIEYLISFIGGFFSVFSPCILPVLPVIFATAEGKWWKSVLVVIGLVFSFGILGLFFGVLGSLGAVRYLAFFVLFVFALVLLFDLRIPRMDSLSGILGKKLVKSSTTPLYPFFLGMSLGAIWSPCIGPILGAIVGLVSLSGSAFAGLLIMLSYAAGMAITIALLLFTGSKLSDRFMENQKLIKRIFGGIVLVFLFLMISGILDSFEVFLVERLEAFEIWVRDTIFT